MKHFLKNKLPPQLLKLYRLFTRKDRVKLLGLFGMMLLAAVLEVAGIGIIPAFVATVADPEGVREYPVVGEVIRYLEIGTQRELLTYGALMLIGVFLVKNIYLAGFHYYKARFIFNRRYDLSRRLMQAYMQAPYTFYLQRNTSGLLRNATQEVSIFTNAMLVPLLQMIMELVIATGIMVFLLVMEPVITLLVFTVLGLTAGFFLYYTSEKTKAYGLKAQGHRQGMIKTLSQGLGGIKDVRVLNRESHFMSHFNREARGSANAGQYQAFVAQVPKPLVETLAVMGMLGIALIMVWQGRAVTAIIPVLSLFAMGIFRLMPAVKQIMNLYTKVRYNIVTVDPIYDDLQELKTYQRQRPQVVEATERIALDHAIEAQNLVYHYPGSEEKALNGVDFSIQKGSAVAFTGPSGAGKTTVADILLGLLEPQDGQVLVDGKPAFDNLSAWQRNIGYIPQFIYLADETLRENIAFGLPPEEIDEAQVQHAVQMAQLEEMVNKLPQGLDTVIGERGTRLSGGQRQRVGIARALYHDPQVLIMDEATSALDNLTEKYIVRAIEQLRGNRTVIMIAHRLTTVQNCDTIYFMQEGKITSSGSYEELLEKNSEFKKLAIGSH